MRYVRMPIEVESPEEAGYDTIAANLAESSMPDRRFADLGIDLGDLVLCYGDHRGEPRLREMIASEAGVPGGDVLLTPGAAGGLFLVHTALLGAGEHIVVVRPNYATNLETPRAIGCDITYVDLAFEAGWRLDMDAVQAAITDRTALVSVTTPHNPTGTVLADADLVRLAEVCAQRHCRLLVDETYRDLAYDAVAPPAAALGAHVISVASMSKAYGLPGIRLGWVVNTDAGLMETLLAAKEQSVICGSVLDEAVAAAVYARRDELRPAQVKAARTARGTVAEWIAGVDDLEWVEPAGGAVCFPRITPGSGVDPVRFHAVLRDELGTWVGPGHWFEQDPRHFRLGFGWPAPAELELGLANIGAALVAAGGR